MTGHIRRRGERSWEIKFDLGTDPVTKRRLTKYHSFRGTKREAEAELVRIKAGAAKGDYVDPSKITVQELLERWLRKPRGDKPLSPKTRESYGSLLTLHVYPDLGVLPAQKIQPDNFRTLYETLAISGNRPRKKDGMATGLSSRTIRYVHSLVKDAFRYGVELKIVQSNPLDTVKPPKRVKTPVHFLDVDQIRDVVEKVRGRPIYVLAMLALGTGMRRSEMLALRWRDVDLDAGLVTVSRSLEQTKGRKLRFKEPKTADSVRTLVLPRSIITELRAKWTEQSKLGLALGAGRPDADGLIFSKADGTPLLPNSVSTEWRRVVTTLKLPVVKFHGLRHSHASYLLASGMDIVSVSKQLGHADPVVTLTVYAHPKRAPDTRAAVMLEQALGLATDSERPRTIENGGGGNPVAIGSRLHPTRRLSN